MIKNYLTPPITGFLLVRTNNIYNRRNFGLKAQSTNPSTKLMRQINSFPWGKCKGMDLKVDWVIPTKVYQQKLGFNKVKGRISKLVFQENKARQIFRKTNISYPLVRKRTCTYQGVNVRFSGNLAYFVFLKHPFWDSPFCLITDELLVFIVLFDTFFLLVAKLYVFIRL